jgi:hypothetical protein
MEKLMLQPINTVLPTIAADPYNINVAMPTVDPIGTEQRIEQINQMRAQQQAQRQQLRQGEMNIEMQRQQLAQQNERFAFERQKFEAQQMDAINTLRSTMYDEVDKVANVPVYSEGDKTFIENWKKTYEIENVYDVLATGDKTQIAGVEAKIAKATADPEYQKYVRKVKMSDGMMSTLEKNPGNVNIGAARSVVG